MGCEQTAAHRRGDLAAKDLFGLERHGAKTLGGLLTRLAAKVAAYACGQLLNARRGRTLGENELLEEGEEDELLRLHLGSSDASRSSLACGLVVGRLREVGATHVVRRVRCR